MFASWRAKLKELRSDCSGNTMLLVALGMPALIGGAGLAVDTAQWYMWKRELQFAVDQAALAGAWARTVDETASTYATRAKQELDANISVTADIVAEPSITLANYAGGAQNSVIVSVTATRSLPFSSFITGQAVTVLAYAQASFDEGRSYTSCLIALDEDDDGAVTIGGSSILTAGCGLASLSTSSTSVRVNGNPEVDAGWIVSRGGIDQWFKDNTDNVIQEYMDGLYDPYSDLTAPNPAESQVNRNYACVKGTKTTRANIKNDVETTYTYYKGHSPDTNGDGAISSAELAAATWDLQENSKGKPKETSSTSQSYVIVENDTVDGVTTTTTRTITKTNNSTGANATWEMKTTVTTKTQSGTTVTETPEQATALPGTYTGGIKVGCNTVFGTGVYIIDGGGLDISGQHTVTGSSVMFVLKNGAYVKINGGSNINLTAIQASDLIARGVSTEQANKLAGMLIFEDRNSSGTSRNTINGNASTVLNGTIYLPKSGLTFSGTASVTSQCLMIAAATINITGDANMTTFCPAGAEEDTTVANTAPRVKLVA
jgi:Flp pilus assembly protein TadG